MDLKIIQGIVHFQVTAIQIYKDAAKPVFLWNTLDYQIVNRKAIAIAEKAQIKLVVPRVVNVFKKVDG